MFKGSVREGGKRKVKLINKAIRLIQLVNKRIYGRLGDKKQNSTKGFIEDLGQKQILTTKCS